MSDAKNSEGGEDLEPWPTSTLGWTSQDMFPITTRPDLTRTRAAIAAYDAIDAEITDTMTQDEADDFFKRSDAAKLAIGDAFALDTADRNESEVARSWAAFNVNRTREFVAVLTA